MSTILYGLFVTTAVSCGLTYRWSIKSTAIIWLPLLWAVRPPNPKNEPWSAHLKLKTTSDLNRVVVFYSVVVLLLFSAKYVLFIAESSLSRSVEVWHGWLGERLGEFVAAFFVRPGEIPIWQLAWTTNALLAITVFFLVRSWLRRAEVGLAVPDTRINRTLAVLYFFRRLLTSYIITCNFVAIIQLARKLPVPEIGSKLFPWL